MPRFPINKTGEMTREEKYAVLAVYVSKIVDHIQGVPHERPIFRRPHYDHTGSSQILEDQQSQDLLYGAEKRPSAYQDRQKREGSALRPDNLAPGEEK